MSDPFRHSHVLAHIERVGERRPEDGDRLVAALIRRCWPGGQSDRSEPGAFAWVRRWGADGVVPQLEGCGCAHGHCVVCN